MRPWFPRVLLVTLGCVLAFEIVTLISSFAALLPIAYALWLILPGVALIDRVAGASAGHRRVAAWLIGPALGLGFSVFGLLLCWVIGLQNAAGLVIAPLFSWLLVLAARRLGVPSLRLPSFDRRDIVAVALVLLVVPLVTLAPYDHVREPTPDGEAYRAYFTADFVWAMTVTGEIAKGSVPPVNPFLRNDSLHYYWMSHLLSGALHRNLQPLGVTSEQVLLLDGLVFGLAFVPFFYALARIAGGSPAFSAIAVAAAFLANSYEGLDRLLVYRQEGTPLDTLRMVNIDAVTRWYYQGMPADGLQRMLLYQPHHLTGYVLSLAALWLVGVAEDVTETSVALWAGILLGLGLMFSSFTAIIVGPALALLFAYRLLARRAWAASWQSAILGALPVIVSVAACNALGYTDRKQGLLIQVGLNPVALRHLPFVLLLSFGPLLFAGLAGVLRGRWMRHEGAPAVALVVGAFAFYFFADVPDQGGVWVGWRSGHLLFVAFTVMGAAALTAAWTMASRRVAVVALLVLLLAPALPTVAIDVYNAQDITNRGHGATFPWTLIVMPQEREALDWIKNNTALDATVQVEPAVRHSGTWAYVQAFGERRGVAGLPGAMIPAYPYHLATANVTQGIFGATRAEDALAMARAMGINYLFVGPPERERYPAAAALFAAHPDVFVPAFRNSAVAIYDVRRR